MGARVLVTGAAGFAGSHLVEHLTGTGYAVTGWRHTGGRQPPPGIPAAWESVDLLDPGGVARAMVSARPSLVFHCAGRAQTAGAHDTVGATFEVNVRGTLNLLSAIERHAPGTRVLVTSSALVYRPSPEPLDERSPIGPSGPYAISKLAQDMLATRAAAAGLDVVVARPFNHIGPRQTADFVASSVARQIALIERGAVPPVLHVGNLSAARDFTDVRDVVAAYARLGQAGKAGECYNVCSEHATPVEAIVRALVAQSRVPIEITVDPERFKPVDLPLVVGSAAKLRRATGWAPAIPLERTLDDLLEWWRSESA